MRKKKYMDHALIWSRSFTNGFDWLREILPLRGGPDRLLLLQRGADDEKSSSTRWYMPYETFETDAIDKMVDVGIFETAIREKTGISFSRHPKPFYSKSGVPILDFERRYFVGTCESSAEGLKIAHDPAIIGYGWFTVHEALSLPMQDEDKRAIQEYFEK